MSTEHIRIPVAYAIKNINAIEILAGFHRAAQESGWTAAQLEETIMEAMSGDNKHLHRVLARYCVKPSGR
jgi:hypothetical protein